MSKLPTRKVNSDDCVIYIGRKYENGKIVEQGTAHKVHEGEWVEVYPVTSVRSYLALQPLKDKPNENALREFCEVVANNVASWNWTDLEGRPLPQPYRNVDVIKLLSDDEVFWLYHAILGETPTERKKD